MLLTAFVCFFTTAVYAFCVYWVDRYEKEPIWLLTAVFFWGAVPGIICAVFLVNLLPPLLPVFIAPPAADSSMSAVLLAPIVEEVVKGVALVGILRWFRNQIDSPLDGIIYGAMIGLGFGMVENFFYFIEAYRAGGWSEWLDLVILRAGVFGLNHALFSGVMGLGIGFGILHFHDEWRRIAPFLGWVGAIGLHMLHNFLVGSAFALAGFVDWGSIFILLVIISWALLQERQWRIKYLKSEVYIGTITMGQYEVLIDRKKRRSRAWYLVSHLEIRRFLKMRRLLHFCSKLAYLKHHIELHPEDDTGLQELRTQVLKLSQQM